MYIAEGEAKGAASRLSSSRARPGDGVPVAGTLTVYDGLSLKLPVSIKRTVEVMVGQCEVSLTPEVLCGEEVGRLARDPVIVEVGPKGQLGSRPSHGVSKSDERAHERA